MQRPKGQLISKANFEVFISTKKNEQKHFYISPLASKMGLIIKIMHNNLYSFFLISPNLET